MTARPSDEPMFNGWQLTCGVLAAVIVYLFDQQFYEAVTLPFLAGGGLLLQIGPVSRSILHWVAGDCCFWTTLDQGFHQLLRLVFVITPVAVVLFVLQLVCYAIVLILLIPSAILYWIATNPGPLRYLLDVIVVFFVALFLYGTAFPLLWLITEPLVALTLGELTFQRIRARVYGVRPRYSQPLYLIVAFVGLTTATIRVVVPPAVAGVSSTWHRISDPVFRPEWPKQFVVAAGTTVPTGIHLQGNEELTFRTNTTTTTPTVSASVEPDDARYGKGRHYGLKGGQSAPWGFEGRAGVLYLWGGSENMVVTVYGPPVNRGRNWWVVPVLPTPTPHHAKSSHRTQRKRHG